jgi:Uncharacterized protein conserved in bacteria
MEGLLQHLEQLIIQHDYAILPEFGGFIVNYVPAKIDESRNLITAPCKEIVFNPALNYNDGLLAGSIQQTENVSFRKANLIVRDNVDELKKRLKNGETVALGKIGSLHLNENGQTEFISADSYDFLPDNIGNYDIRLRHVNHEEEGTSQIVLQLPTTKRRFYKYAAVFVTLIALAALTPLLHMHFSPYLAKLNPLDFFQKDSVLTDSTHKHLIVALTEDTNELKKDSLAKTAHASDSSKNKCKAPWHVIAGSYPTKVEAVDKARELQKQPAYKNTCIAYCTKLQKSAIPTVKNPTTVQTQPQGQQKAWHIVVANFETPNKALRFAQQQSAIEKMLIEAYGTNNVYRIITGSYSSEKEAEIKLAEIRKHAAFKTAWVLHNPVLLNYPLSSKQAVTPKPAVQPSTPKTVSSSSNVPQLTTDSWYVVVGNYVTLQQAQQYANETGKAEKVSLSVVKDKKFYRVIAGSFSDKEAANAKIKELHKHSAFAEAWAFHKPQK